MTETIVRAAPPEAPWHPRSRTFSKITGKYSIEVSDNDLEELINMVYAVWDTLADEVDFSDEADAAIRSLADRVSVMKRWTG